VAVIGTFRPSKQGGWEGRILTLTIDRKVRFVPNDNRQSEQAPAFLALVGWSRIGEAWEARSRGDNSRDFLRVQLFDPIWPEPLRGALFPAPNGLSAELVWSRSDPTKESGRGP